MRHPAINLITGLGLILISLSLSAQNDLPEFKRIPTEGVLRIAEVKMAVDLSNKAERESSNVERISILSSALRHDKQPIIYFNRSLVYLMDGQADRSLEDVISCLKLRNCPIEIHWIAARANFLKSNYQKVLAEYKGVDNLIYNNYTANLQMATASFELKEYDDAFKYALQAKRIKPGNEIDQLIVNFEKQKEQLNEIAEVQLGGKSSKYHLNQTELKNGIRSLKGTGQELTGEVFERYENGDIKMISFYKQGIRDSIYKEFWRDGKEHIVSSYLKGKLTGTYKKINENEILIEESNYLNGEKSGEYKEYWSNGKLKIQCRYDKGKFLDEFKRMNEKGALVEKAKYSRDGKLVNQELYDDSGMNAIYRKTRRSTDAGYDIVEYNSYGNEIIKKTTSSNEEVQSVTEITYHSSGPNQIVKIKANYSVSCPDGSKVLHGIYEERFANNQIKLTRTYDCGKMTKEIYY